MRRILLVLATVLIATLAAADLKKVWFGVDGIT